MAAFRSLHLHLARATTVLAVVLAATLAWADSLDDAESFLAAGDADAARTALAAWFDEGAPDGAGLLRAAQVARKIPDLDLLGRVSGAAETVEQQGGSADLDLALGFAYLGLAEENLRLRTGSRSIGLYFADAAARADKVPPGDPHADLAARLAGAARYAQGDLAGAVERLQAYRAQAKDTSPEFEALFGRLVYERGAALPVLATGHPQPAARADFEAAVDALAHAIAAEELTEAQRRSARLRLAWSLHRLGDIPQALVHYETAYAPRTQDGTYVLRGLQSLLAREPDRLVRSLEGLTRAHPGDPALLDALVVTHLGRKDAGAAVLAAAARLDVAPEDADGWWRMGDVLLAVGQRAGAVRHLGRALELDGQHLAAAASMERAAQQIAAADIEGALAIYERLMELRPRDPYCRNNLGFLLREHVSRFAPAGQHALQKIELGAPERVQALLRRCVEVYGEAEALIDPALDGTRPELEAWNLAGIVNDYGLMLHFFVDVQDAERAERAYLRALRMTDHGFKDTYLNLRRLYTTVLTDRPWAWYLAAREARDGVLMETQDDQGAPVLVPDPQKRALATKDVELARARVVQVLEEHARADGLPWPPTKENGNDR